MSEAFPTQLFPPEFHPHGMDATQFVDLFTADKPVVFAFHGYQRAIHQIVQGRPHAERIHVRGFNEQGNTTTPFDIGGAERDKPLSAVHRSAAARRGCASVAPR